MSLCRRCRCWVARDEPACRVCGTVVAGSAPPPLDLVLPDGARIPLAGVLSVGRGADATVRLSDRTVSRIHARILAGGGPPILEDAGSSHGTVLDGEPLTGRRELRDGSVIRLGDVTLRVERRRADEEAGRTIVFPAAVAVEVAADGTSSRDDADTTYGTVPRVRAGAALKRLPASEGPLRWVVLAPSGTEVARLGDAEAELLMLLDGESGLADLVTAAEARFGAGGTARLARLLGDLADRGFLEGVDAAPDAADGRLARLVRPRQWVVRGLGPRITRAYRAGGWVLFTRPVQVAVVLVAVVGLLAYADLLAQRGGTPFVVADRVGLGGLVFMLGRFLVAAVHETAHALTMAAFGRSVDRAGIKTVVGIPFVFVDTTEAWFEPRRRRIAVSAAGPVSDFALGGLFGLTAWLLPAGNTRDIMFQLTLAAYVGALFNLNPFLDRDGYHILVDRLGEPGLRRRARTWLAARLSGREVEGPASRALVAYAVLSVGWLVVSALFVVLLSTLYYGRLTAIAPEEVVWAVFVAFYLLLFLPVAMVVGRPLLQRRRRAPRVEAAGEPTA